MYPYVVKQLYEAYKRYAQLQAMIQQGRANIEYLRHINSGLDDILGLVESLPIRDEKVLEEVKNFRSAIRKINELYGVVPRSGEAAMQTLHDETIAESIKLTNSAKTYAESQERNANRAFEMADHMSPKGAARLAASTNAQILHTLSQILRLQGQMLKMHGEEFALTNKQDKDSVGHFNKINSDVKKSLTKFEGTFELPRF